MAVALSNPEMMSMLLSSGADPNAKTTESQWSESPATPLHYAIRYCADDDDDNNVCNTIIRLLLDAGADPYATPNAPFSFACFRPDPSIAQFILQLRPLPCPPPNGNSLVYNILHVLGYSTDPQGHLRILKAVLASDPTLTLNTHNDPQRNNIPPIFYMHKFTPETARALLELGQDPNITGSPFPPSTYCLLSVVLNSGPEVVKVFLDAGADPTGGPNVTETPLHRLAKSYHPKAVESARLLVAAGANVNAVDEQGFTPLHCAAAGGNGVVWNDNRAEELEALIKYLLEMGADPEAKNKQGLKPVECCRHSRAGDAARRVLESWAG
ncbi:hypothetical protein HK104_000952 [Borealophlyctis nickersoniae]|nr:hypothetical protein HK104_000952 [Borealophlyctis nickersoniae]